MKVKLAAALVALVSATALIVVANAGAPNRPPPQNCPAGYTKDPASTDTAILCTRTVTREVVREVVREVPGPERVVVVEKPVERVVVKVKKIRVVKWKTRTVVKIKKVRVPYFNPDWCKPPPEVAG